jgi:hypothetical protein
MSPKYTLTCCQSTARRREISPLKQPETRVRQAARAIFVGKARQYNQYNRAFLQMCSHRLIAPVACTPAVGWERGQVENQVGNLRDLLLRPKPQVKSLVELSAWLEDQCIAYARSIPPINSSKRKPPPAPASGAEIGRDLTTREYG